MKKTITLLPVLFLVVFLAGCNKSEPGAQEQSSQKNQNQEKKEEQKEESKSQSLKDLVSNGENVKCTWKSQQPSGETIEGVSYVSGKNYYHESNIKQGGEETIVYTMSDGEWVYNWGNMNGKGTKMKLEETEEMQEEGKQTEPTQNEAYRAQQQMQQDMAFDCQPWKVDNSKFTPPGNIEFDDMVEMMNQMKQQSQGMEQQTQSSGQTDNQTMQDACGMCDSLSSPAKEECLANCQ